VSSDSPSKPTLVMLATAWGPKFGGINVFNVELARSLGVMKGRHFDLICVVPNSSSEDLEDARRHRVRLLPLGTSSGSLAADDAPKVSALLSNEDATGVVVWVGHDDKTGPLALALKSAWPGSHAVVFHHMAFRAYGFTKGGTRGQAKHESQRELFRRADLCVSVGPLLHEHLQDLLSDLAPRPPLEWLVPGLAEPDPDVVSLSVLSPNNFVAFIGGRLGGDDERIKQPMLGVRAFGYAVQLAMAGGTAEHGICQSPLLRMRGLPEDQYGIVSQALNEEASQIVNCDLAGYTEDRSQYFADLSTSSVALMPSWHEGFGLAAWEAIACQVPTVISKQSGVYRLLNGRLQGAGLGHSVWPVEVGGCASSAIGVSQHSDDDVLSVGRAIHEIGARIDLRKRDAVQLASNLRNDHGFTREACATRFAQFISQHLGLVLFVDAAHAQVSAKGGAPQPTLSEIKSKTLPAFLRLPAAQKWQSGLGLSPSALLLARDRIAGFDPVRDSVIDSWLAKLQDASLPALTVRLVTGPGGMGKTRSALEFVRRAEEIGYQGLWLASQLSANAIGQLKTSLANISKPVLLVVDYAEDRQEELLLVLDALLTRVRKAGQAGGARRRILVFCLARVDAWWSGLSSLSGCTDAVTSLLIGPANLGIEAIPKWPEDPSLRESTFHRALGEFARATNQAVPVFSWLPEFSEPMFDRPLYLHLAALAALEGERPQHANALLTAQLSREYRHWLRRAAGMAVPYADWADAMAWLALVKTATCVELQSTLDSLGLLRPGLALAFQEAYPGVDHNVQTLQPDLLSEALLVERLAARRGSAIVEQALGRGGIQCVMTLLAIARLGRAQDDPTGGKAPVDEVPIWLETVVGGLSKFWRQYGQLFVDLGHALGHDFAKFLTPAWRVLASHEQPAIAQSLRLPEFSTPLVALSVEIARAELKGAAQPLARAVGLGNLAARLRNLGDPKSRSEALDCGTLAVEAYRRLKRPRSDDQMNAAGATFRTLSYGLAEQADSAVHALAVRYSRVALRIHRRIAARHSSFKSNLVTSQGALAKRLVEVASAASIAEATHLFREAIATCKNWMPPRGSVEFVELYFAQSDLGAHFSENGFGADGAEALDCTSDALHGFRMLAAHAPATYLPQVAVCLHNLASIQSASRSPATHEKALECARECVGIRRKLVAAHRATFLLGLASSLLVLAMCVWARSEGAARAEAISFAREGIALLRELHLDQSRHPLLALGNCNLAVYLSISGDPASKAEAESLLRDVVAAYRNLAHQQQYRYLPKLAAALTNLANVLSDRPGTTARIEAMRRSREAVRCYEALAHQRPVVFGGELARAMQALDRLKAAGRHC
jgi:glycosyltransferase involved in cell wall biosynthesis